MSDVAKLFTTSGFMKESQKKSNLDSTKILYVHKKVLKDGVQARTGAQQENYSYVVLVVDDRLNVDYLAFLINSSPWKVMLGEGSKFFEGASISTSLGALKKLPVVMLFNEEQNACSFLNTLITMTYDAIEKESVEQDGFQNAYRFLLGIRDCIAMEILFDGVLSNPDISVLSSWIEKKTVYDNTSDKKEALVTLFKSIFSSNDDLRDRMNKMRLYMDENADAIFNNFPQ